MLLASSTLTFLLVIRPLLFIRVEGQLEKFLQELEGFQRLTNALNLATGEFFADATTLFHLVEARERLAQVCPTLNLPQPSSCPAG